MPCYILLFNLLTWPRAMCEDIVRLGMEPILIDQGSTYPPLLDWLKNCPFEVIPGHNHGGSGDNNFRRHERVMNSQDLFAFTDQDLDLSPLPDDSVERMKSALQDNRDVCKAGVSLRLDDIPDHFGFRDEVKRWESKFWKEKRNGCYRANISTTLAVYDPARRDLWNDRRFFHAVRLDSPYTARHLAWYVDSGNIDEEFAYYLKTRKFGYWSRKLGETCTTNARLNG